MGDEGDVVLIQNSLYSRPFSLDDEKPTRVDFRSKQFDVDLYMREKLAEYSVEKLQGVIQTIRDELSSSTGQQRNLIVAEFAGFVDSVIAQKRLGTEIEESKFHSPAYNKTITTTLDSLQGQWEVVFRPVLDTRHRCGDIELLIEAIRSHSEYFNLVPKLHAAIASESFSQVTAVHRRARGLLKATNSPALKAAVQPALKLLETHAETLKQELLCPFKASDRGRRDDIIALLTDLGVQEDPVPAFLRSAHQHLRRAMELADGDVSAAPEWCAAIESLHRAASMHGPGKMSQRSAATVRREGLPLYPPLDEGMMEELEVETARAMMEVIDECPEVDVALRTAIAAQTVIGCLPAPVPAELETLRHRLTGVVVQNSIEREVGKIETRLGADFSDWRVGDMYRKIFYTIADTIPPAAADDICRSAFVQTVDKLAATIERVSLGVQSEADDEVLSSAASTFSSVASSASGLSWDGPADTHLLPGVVMLTDIRQTVVPEACRVLSRQFKLTVRNKKVAKELEPAAGPGLVLSPSFMTVGTPTGKQTHRSHQSRMNLPRVSQGPEFEEEDVATAALYEAEARLLARFISSRAVAVHTVVSEALRPTAIDTTVAVVDGTAEIPGYAADTLLTISVAAAECETEGLSAGVGAAIAAQLIAAALRSMLSCVTQRHINRREAVDIYLVATFFARLATTGSIVVRDLHARLACFIADATGLAGVPELERECKALHSQPCDGIIDAMMTATKLYCQCLGAA
ncbi:Exocyst complex component Sec5 [Carpediemonas membranifera]|uniref:Exocyst complex component n=1 Tax=Carpediemonas membranifera TaxID=201153 RepID=A0A8J6E3H7_9EUKA|nr:Exocyst complex component Sec5 [Carpediemonas membranifera]|eukprot:KAG9395948.1 Exocyst complex component Sec5 [Carpediemonas membranifera]